MTTCGNKRSTEETAFVCAEETAFVCLLNNKTMYATL